VLSGKLNRISSNCSLTTDDDDDDGMEAEAF